MTKLKVNLELLTSRAPQLTQKFSHYVAKRIVDAPEGQRDLVVDGEYFYGVDAHRACAQQVEQFIQQPISHSVSYKNVENAKTGHQRVINVLNAQASATAKDSFNHVFQTLIILGGACGFHLPLLLDRLDVRNVILVEPDDDMLFHCLSNIDLRDIDKRCELNGGVFAIVQPTSVAEFGEQLKGLSREWGCGFLAKISVFRHYQTDTFDSIFDNIRTLRTQCLSGWGFFEDEIVGLEHTVTNVDERASFFHGASCARDEELVLIIGNGPSLDDALPMLRRVRKHTTLISCGSATATLLNAGIVPHIHAEMERSDNQFALNKRWLRSEITDNILLIALNTVSPLMLRAFKHKRLFEKANDLGASFLQGGRSTPLFFCNPTATNFACAASIRMGWKKIAFIGCDYGYKQVTQHHAAQSDYFDPRSALSDTKYYAELTLKGNFGGEVYSQRIFNLSRLNIEQLLHRHHDVEAFNTSDGAFIEGARPTPLHVIEGALTSGDSIADEIVTRLLPGNKILRNIDNDHLDNALGAIEQFVRRITSELDNAQSTQAICTSLVRFNRIIETQHNGRAIYFLFSGVLKFFHVVIQGHTTRVNMESQREYFCLAKKELKAYFQHCLTLTQRLYEKRNAYEV